MMVELHSQLYARVHSRQPEMTPAAANPASPALDCPLIAQPHFNFNFTSLLLATRVHYSQPLLSHVCSIWGAHKIVSHL